MITGLQCGLAVGAFLGTFFILAYPIAYVVHKVKGDDMMEQPKN